jgi:transposase
MNAQGMAIQRFVAAAREGRSLTARRSPGSRLKLDEGARRLLEADLQERPAATLAQRREVLSRVRGVEISDATVSRTLGHMGWSRKKVGRSDGTRRVPEAAWRALVAGVLDAQRLVFVDEMGTNTSLAPLYARSRRVERAHAKAPRNWAKNITLLASISIHGMGRAWRSKAR